EVHIQLVQWASNQECNRVLRNIGSGFEIEDRVGAARIIESDVSPDDLVGIVFKIELSAVNRHIAHDHWILDGSANSKVSAGKNVRQIVAYAEAPVGFNIDIENDFLTLIGRRHSL